MYSLRWWLQEYLKNPLYLMLLKTTIGKYRL